MSSGVGVTFQMGKKSVYENDVKSILTVKSLFLWEMLVEQRHLVC